MAARHLGVLAFGALIASGGIMTALFAQTPSKMPRARTVVVATGNLHVPTAYRTTYQFLGSWAVSANQGQGSKELHLVYASPGTVAAYNKNGRFPDGTVLVKEVFQAATGPMTTGTVSHADTLKGWFVMMKDSKSRFAGNKLWGDGWARMSRSLRGSSRTGCAPPIKPTEGSWPTRSRRSLSTK